MANRAQLTQARSRQRREALLTAAIELFADGGTRAITHRGVAKQAGLPSATTTYYFASIDTLIHEALSEHVGQWIQTLEGIIDLEWTADIDLDEAAGFVEYAFDQRSPAVAGLELSIFLAACRDPGLSDLAGQALTSLQKLAATLLRAVGVGDPEELSSAVIALIAGTAVRRQSPTIDEAAEARMLATAIRDLVAASQIPESDKHATLAGLAGTTPAKAT